MLVQHLVLVMNFYSNKRIKIVIAYLGVSWRNRLVPPRILRMNTQSRVEIFVTLYVHTGSGNY